MKCKPNPALPNPAASRPASGPARPCAGAGESLAWSKTIPSEDPWMDAAHGCRQRPEHSVGKAFFPFCGVERAEAWSMEKRGAKNPGGCLPAPGRGRRLSSAAERGRPHPHPNEHPLLLLPVAACQLWGRRLEAKSLLSQGSLAPRHPGGLLADLAQRGIFP